MKMLGIRILVITVICVSAISSGELSLDKVFKAAVVTEKILVVTEKMERRLKQLQEEELRKKKTQKKLNKKETPVKTDK
jgi:transposase